MSQPQMQQQQVSEEQRDAVIRYQRLREQVDQMYSKLTQIETDSGEHDLVIKSLMGLAGERRCWHQVGAVLAEKKVKDVLPLLRMNNQQFAEAMKKITGQISVIEAEASQLQSKYKIVMRRK